MFKRLALCTAMMAALPAYADGIKEFTDEERAQFRAEVRAYLLENPEVLFEAIAIHRAREAEAKARADMALVAAHRDTILNDGYSYVGGNPEGDVTMVEFIDYRCGYCKKAHAEVAQLLKTDGNIRFIIKELPILGEESVLAARFAVAIKQIADDETYKAVSDALMEMRGAVSLAALRRLAETYGLDTAEVEKQMDSDAVTQVLAKTRELAKALQISGTPAFVLEDQLLRGYLPYSDLKKIVDDKRG